MDRKALGLRAITDDPVHDSLHNAGQNRAEVVIWDSFVMETSNL